jgi:hypothetical protein
MIALVAAPQRATIPLADDTVAIPKPRNEMYQSSLHLLLLVERRKCIVISVIVPYRDMNIRRGQCLDLCAFQLLIITNDQAKAVGRAKAIPIDAKICDKLVESKGLDFDPSADESTVFDKNKMASTTTCRPTKIIPSENLRFILRRRAAGITAQQGRSISGASIISAWRWDHGHQYLIS